MRYHVLTAAVFAIGIAVVAQLAANYHLIPAIAAAGAVLGAGTLITCRPWQRRRPRPQYGHTTPPREEQELA